MSALAPAQGQNSAAHASLEPSTAEPALLVLHVHRCAVQKLPALEVGYQQKNDYCAGLLEDPDLLSARGIQER